MNVQQDYYYHTAMEGSSVLLKNMKGHRNYNFLLPIKAKYVVDKSKAQAQKILADLKREKRMSTAYTNCHTEIYCFA
jgi:hypothetical protein